jgi:hypothetical protein
LKECHDHTPQLQADINREIRKEAPRMRTERFRARAQPKTILAETNITPFMKPQPIDGKGEIDGIAILRFAMIFCFAIVFLKVIW